MAFKFFEPGLQPPETSPAALRDRRFKAREALCIQVLGICVILALAWLGDSSRMHPEDLIRFVSWMQVLLLIWMIASWNWVTKTLFDPYILFVFAAAMFHAGQQILDCLHLSQRTFLFGLFPPEVSLQAIFLVLLSFAFLHLGALTGVATSGRSRPVNEASRGWRSKHILALGIVLFAISAVPGAIMLREAVSATMSGGYFFALFAHQGATGFAGIRNFLASFLVPSALFLLAGSRGTKSLPRLLSAAVITLYSALFLFIGSRTVAALAFGVYAWLWDRLVRPIPRMLIVSTLLVAVLIVFPLIAITRNTSGETRLSWDYLQEKWSELDRPATASLTETGGSLVTVAYTLELVPTVRDFDWGVSYLYALTTVFPNLFWDVHPAVAHGSPGSWMMNVVDPINAAAGGGLGYSFIAEAYYNFGWAGPLFIACLGLALGRLACWVSGRPEPLRCVCVANALIPLLWSVRNDASGALRDIVWFGLGPYLLIRAFELIQQRVTGPQPLNVVPVTPASRPNSNLLPR